MEEVTEENRDTRTRFKRVWARGATSPWVRGEDPRSSAKARTAFVVRREIISEGAAVSVT